MTLMSRRERKKFETRRALEKAAWRLFTQQGYTETTIVDITESVDVAERTFFRYFECKEAVLFGDWRSRLGDLAESVRERPVDEPPLVAVRNGVIDLAERYEADDERMLILFRLMTDTPTIRDYQRQIVQPAWEDTLAQALAARLRVDPTSDLRPHVFAGAAVAALHAAVIIWWHANGEPQLASLVVEALDLLEPPHRAALSNDI